MPNKFGLLLLFLIAAFTGVAQKSAPADALEANLRKHVQYLASDQLEGRKTGEAGGTTAAGYVANQFAQSKLKPGIKTEKGKGNFLQAFPYISGVSPNPGSDLAFNNASTGERKLEPGVNYSYFANSLNGEVVNAPLVFAGFGISDKGYDDYAGLDVTGKVVLAFNGIPEGLGPRSEFARMGTPMMANIAKERGAKALILIAQSDDFRSDPLSKLSYEPTLGDTAIPVVIIDRGAAAGLLGVKDVKEVNEIEKWLRMKGNAPPYQAETRPVGSVPIGNINATVSLKVDLVKKIVDAYNVIGIVEGNDPTLKNEAIVIGAHYDHLGRGGRSSLSPNSSDIHHGADDNASGTAAIIELARQFAGRNPRGSKGALPNKRTIIFIAFGGEEEGLLGSKHYVNNPVWPLDKTIAMINLDMVGRLNENKLTVGGIGTANEWKQLIEGRSTVGMHTEGLGHVYAQIFSLQLNEDGFGPSDHSSFYGKQIPVLFFFSGTHLDYHKPSDTAEKINYEGLTKITGYVAAIARSIDENPTRPTYKVAASSGMGGRTTFSVSLGTIPSYAEGNDGLGVDGVRDGSPAAKAGLKGGDKIIKLAGKDVRNISDYMFALGVMKAGEEYEVVVKRGTETLTLKIVPAPAARR
ncbi:MAG: M28 family peptidase [Acidobacteria bacterium]|nr:M28 family peptidase [Acidobacteriota bacterium]